MQDTCNTTHTSAAALQHCQHATVRCTQLAIKPASIQAQHSAAAELRFPPNHAANINTIRPSRQDVWQLLALPTFHSTPPPPTHTHTLCLPVCAHCLPLEQQTESSTLSPRVLVTRIFAQGVHTLLASPWNSPVDSTAQHSMWQVSTVVRFRSPSSSKPVPVRQPLLAYKPQQTCRWRLVAICCMMLYVLLCLLSSLESPP